MNWRRKPTTADGKMQLTNTEGNSTGATHVLKDKNRSKGAQKYSNVSKKKKKNPPEIKEGLNLQN